MGLAKFNSKKIFVDTAPFIYFIEKKSRYFSLIEPFFKANLAGQVLVCTSVITLMELLVRPISAGREDLVELYQQKFDSSEHFQMTSIDQEVAVKAAEIRAKYNMKTPDALQLASAATMKADFFLTNDLKLRVFNELPIITIDDL